MKAKQQQASQNRSTSASLAIRQLQLSFNLPLHPKDITRWRGAWAELAGIEQHDLFHNHKSASQYHYRYPLVQYRVRRNQAALLAFNDGVQSVQQVLAQQDWQINWKGEPFKLSIENLQMHEPRLHFLDEPELYRIHYWLPFNQDNYKRWHSSGGLQSQVELLNRILVGQLLCFFTGMHWQLPQRLEAEIVHIHRSGKIEVHGTKRPAIDVVFRCNVRLPIGIGIGKAVAFGFGQTYPLRRRRRDGRQGPGSSVVSD